jgi:hypothetical protein
LKANQELEAAFNEIMSIEEELEDIIQFLPDATFVIDKEVKLYSGIGRWKK